MLITFLWNCLNATRPHWRQINIGSGYNSVPSGKWRHRQMAKFPFPCHWPFVWGNHRRIPLTKASNADLCCFSLICAWTNGWASNGDTGDLRRHRAHYDSIVMQQGDTWNNVEKSYEATWRHKKEWLFCHCAVQLKSSWSHKFKCIPVRSKSVLSISVMAGQQQQISMFHDDVIEWKHFPLYWSFLRGIHRSPVNSHHKGQWRGALMFAG